MCLWWLSRVPVIKFTLALVVALVFVIGLSSFFKRQPSPLRLRDERSANKILSTNNNKEAVSDHIVLQHGGHSFLDVKHAGDDRKDNFAKHQQMLIKQRLITGNVKSLVDDKIPRELGKSKVAKEHQFTLPPRLHSKKIKTHLNYYRQNNERVKQRQIQRQSSRQEVKKLALTNQTLDVVVVDEHHEGRYNHRHR